MSSNIQRICGNDPELTELRLVEDLEAYCADISDLTDALKDNEVIEYVRLDRDFLPSIDDDAGLAKFFQAFGGLPALKEAQIWHAGIPVKFLADFLLAARGLEHLQLGCLDLEGTADDFESFSAALDGHPHLRSFCMHDFSLTNNAISIDGLIGTLATIPNLQIVKIEVTHSRRRSLVGSEAAAAKVSVSLRGEALANLCRCPTLEELYLNRLNLNLEDYAAFAASIKDAPVLKLLALPHCNLDDTACIALSEAIGQSKTLVKIDLSCNRLTDEGCVTLASGLEGNESVKFLRLWGNVKISNNGFDTVHEMLEKNCVLERVPLMTPKAFENRIDIDKVKQKKAQANAA